MATCNTGALLASGKCFCLNNESQQAILTLLCQWLTKLDPMANCTPSTLVKDGKCFCSLTKAPAEIMELELLTKILVALGGAALAPDTLLSRGKCFCPVTKNPYLIGKLQLLCEIQALE